MSTAISPLERLRIFVIVYPPTDKRSTDAAGDACCEMLAGQLGDVHLCAFAFLPTAKGFHTVENDLLLWFR